MGVVGIVGEPGVLGAGVVGVVGVVETLPPTPTLAVTVADCAVVSVDRATPAAFVSAMLALRVPALVLNVTGIPFIRFPLTSNTVA